MEKCIQDTHNVLIKNMLTLNKLGKFSTEKWLPMTMFIPILIQKMHVM